MNRGRDNRKLQEQIEKDRKTIAPPIQLTPIPLDKPVYYVTVPAHKPGQLADFRRQWQAMLDHSAGEIRPMLVVMPEDIALHDMPLSYLRKYIEDLQDLLKTREQEEENGFRVSEAEPINNLYR